MSVFGFGTIVLYKEDVMNIVNNGVKRFCPFSGELLGYELLFFRDKFIYLEKVFICKQMLSGIQVDSFFNRSDIMYFNYYCSSFSKRLLNFPYKPIIKNYETD